MVDSAILRSHDIVSSLTRLMQSLREDKPLTPIEGKECFNKLLDFEVFCDEHGAESLSKVAKSIQNKLFWEIKPGHPFTHSEKNQLLQFCDTIRIQILAIAAWCSLNPVAQGVNKFLFLPDSEELIKTGAISYGLGGLTYTTFGNHVAIMFSSISDMIQSHDVLVELARVYDITPNDTHWVMDFSGAKELTTHFETVLLSYKKQLNASGRDLYICWLDPKFVCNSKKDLVKELNLELIGGRYFSKFKSIS